MHIRCRQQRLALPSPPKRICVRQPAHVPHESTRRQLVHWPQRLRERRSFGCSEAAAASLRVYLVFKDSMGMPRDWYTNPNMAEEFGIDDAKKLMLLQGIRNGFDGEGAGEDM